MSTTAAANVLCLQSSKLCKYATTSNKGSSSSNKEGKGLRQSQQLLLIDPLLALLPLPLPFLVQNMAHSLARILIPPFVIWDQAQLANRGHENLVAAVVGLC